MTDANDLGGKSDQIAGEAKEVVGKVTGDEELEAEGRGQNIAGHLKEAGHSLLQAGKGLAESAHETLDRHHDDKHDKAGE